MPLLTERGQPQVRKPLQSIWQEVNRVISYIHDTIPTQQLNSRGIGAIAPYLLSDEGWDIVKAEYFAGARPSAWDNFVDAVEKHFGIGSIRQRWQFFREFMKADESSAHFVERLETRRV